MAELVLYPNEIMKYDDQCYTGIKAEITLPDGRVLETHEIYNFDIKPTVVR